MHPPPGFIDSGLPVGETYSDTAKDIHITPIGRGGATSNAWIDVVVRQAAWSLPRQIRLLLVKDVRLFRRDPIQWVQLLFFFALLGLYFFNVRRFSPPDLQQLGWVNLISFLNLSVVGLLMSTFTTRFVFPMVSLEGRRLWTLGLLPLRRETILWGKFFFAVGCSLLPCAALVLLRRVVRDTPRGKGLAEVYALAGFILLDDKGEATAAYQYLLTALELGPKPDTGAEIRRELAAIEAQQRRHVGRLHRPPSW